MSESSSELFEIFKNTDQELVITNMAKSKQTYKNQPVDKFQKKKKNNNNNKKKTRINKNMLDMIQLFLLTLYNLHPVETERESTGRRGVRKG